MAEEVWRTADAWTNYEVSDLGRVRRRTPSHATHVGRLLKPYPNRGYPAVSIWRDGKRYQPSVHSMVATAFLGPRPEGQQINHKDGDTLNPRLDNLEYVTPSENTQHAIKTGLALNGPERAAPLLRWMAAHGVPPVAPEQRPRGETHGSKTRPESILRGSAVSQAKLSEDDVRIIKRTPKARGSGRRLAAQFDVDEGVISKIRRGVNWGHVT